MMAMFRCRISRPIRPIGDAPARTGAPATAAALPASRRTWRILAPAMLSVLPLMQSSATPALAEYHVHRGDVLEISILGSPELHRRIMIDDDGRIDFPVVGEIRVAGLSLSQLRQKLRERLAVHHSFHDPDVTVDVAQYRPIYITDGVAKPGAYPYRPGMTVRDAIALAGGYGRNMPLDGINAHGQYDASLIEFVRLQIGVSRLQAELAGRTDIDLKNLQTDGVTPSVLAKFIDIEAQQLKTDQDDYDNQKIYLSRMIKETQDQISALLAEQAELQRALMQQQRDAARIRGLFHQSLVQISRVEDEDRAVSRSETQLFELKARTAKARRSLEEYTRALQKLADQRKIEVMQRLEKALGELAAVRIQLTTAGARVRYIEAEQPQGFAGDSTARHLVIFRDEHGDQQRIAADENTNLMPGDAVEVTASGALPHLANRTGSHTLAPGPNPAVSASGREQLRDGNLLNATAHAALPPVPIAAVTNKNDAIAAPKPPAEPARRVPSQAPDKSASAAAPLQHSASRITGAVSAPPSAVAPSAGERATGHRLRTAGDMKIIEGDLASARLFYRRAAETGDARAALDLGNSFNPHFLARLGVLGMRGNAVMAARWYRRARMLGDPDAERALRTLSQ
jgi:polysaccharide export outer membrane protein